MLPENAIDWGRFGDWLINNVLLALGVPCACAVALGYIFSQVAWLRTLRDFQVCVYSTSLVGSALYDFGVAGRVVSGVSQAGLIILLVLSSLFAAAAIVASQAGSSRALTRSQELFLVAGSLSTAGLSLIVVLMTRIHEGLL